MARVHYRRLTSLVTAAGAVIIAGVIGCPIGLVAGSFGGWRDAVLMRIIDVLLRCQHSVRNGPDRRPRPQPERRAICCRHHRNSRLCPHRARAGTVVAQARLCTAVEAFGGSSAYNMFRTVLPNAWSPILVQVVVLSSVAILLEAALAFLGVGIPPPTPSWGEMLRTGKSYLYEAPTYAVLPGLVLTLTILSLDTLGRTLALVLEDRQEVVDMEPEAETS